MDMIEEIGIHDVGLWKSGCRNVEYWKQECGTWNTGLRKGASCKMEVISFCGTWILVSRIMGFSISESGTWGLECRTSGNWDFANQSYRNP